jgi:trehalose 6-phosphate phosphatase
MRFRSPTSTQRYAAVLAAAPGALVAVDYDGTLAPIVDDPDAATIHPQAPATLVALAAQVRAVAVVTGRPARQVVDLGDLERVADALPEGARLLVLGQYGHERWDSRSREFYSPEPPAGLAAFRAELPQILAKCGTEDAYLEDKGLAVAVHTRRLPDATDAFVRLEPALADAAERHGLVLEPGRQVLEVRAAGTDKGDAIRTLAEELRPDAIVFAGDDLGDAPAFVAVAALRDAGLPGLLVCSTSQEQEMLADLADVLVDGPDGVLTLLRGFATDAAQPR